MANSHQIKIGLQFSANTTQAQQQLKILENDLNKILNLGQNPNFNFTPELIKGQEAAKILGNILNKAVNLDTGKFDLSKFQQQLKLSGQSLEKLSNDLIQMGPMGQKAFNSMATAITTAENPIRRTNALMDKFAKTLKDTARWQLSSNIVHGFQGAIEQAYYYAQDLNKALNDIRIVTGYNTTQMAKFAEEANRSAKALSTTTDEYTKASLIYFQQGLSDAEVLKRTETTVKMANVTGQTAEEVSSYMTGIWNNFDDGSRSLDSYADSITALGAATASSSEEIAAGLQKFSAVANMVGLSYNYATAALATVTSQTRESADTVGTAFKTIFARLESLSLGETLEDSTTLTKYSQALLNVGINIKNSNGELKNMDQILDELGNKWKEIDKDQQVALAQTVAGMRQYNNFIALLDNYETFKINVEVAENAEGTLEEQAEIYAESWEAAKDRATAAAQEIYSKLINDEFFIDLTNMFTDLLDGIGNFLDAVGGLKTLLPVITTLMLGAFGPKISQGISNMGFNISSMLGQNHKKAEQFKDEVIEISKNMKPKATGGYINVEEQTISDTRNIRLGLQREHEQRSRDMSTAQEARYGVAINKLDTAEQVVLAAAQRVDIAEKQVGLLNTDQKAISEEIDKIKQADIFKYDEQIQNALNDYESSPKPSAVSLDSDLDSIQSEIDDTFGPSSPLSKYLRDLRESMRDKNGNLNNNKTKAAIKKIQADDTKLAAAVNKTDIKNTEKLNKLKEESVQLEIEKTKAQADATQATNEFNKAQEHYKKSVDEVHEAYKKQANDPIDWAKGLTGLATAAASVVAAFGAGAQLVDVWSNPDASGWEKLTATMSTLLTIIPSLVIAWKALKDAKAKDLIVTTASSAADLVKTIATEGLSGAIAKGTAATAANAAAWYAHPIMWIVGIVIAAVAAVALLTAGIVALSDALTETDEEKLERLKEAAKEAASQLEETTKRAEELKAAFDDYKEVQDQLLNCTKGTKEWTEALKENNQKVIDLMAKYPTLASMVNEVGENAVVRNEKTGALEIQDWAMEELQSQVDSAVLASQGAVYAANNSVRTQQIEVDRNSLANKLYEQSLEMDRHMGGGAYELVANKIAENAEDYTGLTKDEIIQKIETDIGSGLFSLGFSDAEGWAETILELGDKFNALATSIDANTNATLAETESLKQSILADNTAVQSSKYAEQIIASTSVGGDETLDKRIEAKLEEMDDEKKGLTTGWGKAGISKGTGVNTEAKNIFAEYAKAADLSGVTLVDTTGTDNYRKFVYTDVEGNRQEVDLDVMRKTVAAKKVNEDIAKEAEDLTKLYERIDNKNAINALVAAQTGKGDALTRGQMTEGYRDSLVKSLNLTTDELKAMGYETIDELKNALEVSQGLAEEAWGKTIDKYKQATNISENLLNERFSNLTTVQLENLTNSVSTIYERVGTVAADRVDSGINKLMETYPDKVQEIADIVGNIDWSKGGEVALQQLTRELEEAGISTENLGSSWEALEVSLKQVQIRIQDFSVDELRSELASISEAIDGIDLGSIISDEAYENLIKYNSALKDFFMLTESGYVFTGDPEQLDDMAKESAITALHSGMETLLTAEKAKSVNQLDKYKTNSYIDDLNFIAEGEEYEAFRQTTGLSSDVLRKAADTIQKYEGKTDLSEDEKRALNNALDIKDNMYAAAEDLENRNLEEEKRRTLELNASFFKTTADLEAAKEDFAKYGEEGLEVYNRRLEFIDKMWEKTREQWEEEIDKYADEQAAIEETNLLLEENARLKEKAHGKDKIKFIEEEIELQEDLRRNYLALQTEANKSAKDAKENLEGLTWLSEMGVGVITSRTTGELLNREQIESAINTYYYRSQDEEGQQQAIDWLNDYSEHNQKRLEQEENIRESLQRTYDAEIEKTEALLDLYDETDREIEGNISTLQYYQDVIEQVGQETLNITNDQMEALGDLMIESQRATLQNAQAKLQFLNSEVERYKALIKAASDEDEIATYKNAIKDLEGQIVDQTENVQSAMLSMLEAITNEFERKVEEILTDFEKGMTGMFSSFERMTEFYDQQSEISAQYLADYKRIYELNKLTRNITKDIDSTDNVKAKRAMRELQEEITDLQTTGAEMSEYDLEYLQKKYDLRVAEIALEEAQNAKSQVRLRKMADGSWGYVYTQNAEAVENAQQNYEDKLYALQELSSNYLQDTSQQILQTQADFNDAIQDIMTSGLTEEEKKKAIEDTVSFYQEKLRYLTDEFDSVIENNMGVVDTVQAFSETLLGTMYPDANSGDDIFTRWANSLGSIEDGTGVLGELWTEFSEFKTAVDDLFNQDGANSPIQNFADKVSTSVDSLTEAIWSLQAALAQGMWSDSQKKDWLKENGQYGSDYYDRLSSGRLNYMFTRDYSQYLKENAEGLATGGYTGSWGPEGKLAILHEKEMVLNKEDTNNLLSIMNIMDRMLRDIDVAAAAATAVSLTPAIVSSSGDTLQQQVTIHAEFPAATNRGEIEEAFNTLINRAAQYTNRKR